MRRMNPVIGVIGVLPGDVPGVLARRRVVSPRRVEVVEAVPPPDDAVPLRAAARRASAPVARPATGMRECMPA